MSIENNAPEADTPDDGLNHIEDLPAAVIPQRPDYSSARGDELAPDTPFAPEIGESVVEMVHAVRHELNKSLGHLRGAVRDMEVATRLITMGPEKIADVIFMDKWFKFHVPFAGDDGVQTEISKNRTFPAAEMFISLLRKVPQGGVFLDIGGYIGEHSLVYAKLLSADHIHVFEPQRVLSDVLATTFAANDVENYTLHTNVVCDDLRQMALGRQQHHRLSETSFVAREDGTYQGISIDSLALDAVDFIKLSFDGTKMLALRGMEETITRCRPIICTEPRGRDIGEQDSFLKERGYRQEPLPQGYFLYFPTK